MPFLFSSEDLADRLLLFSECNTRQELHDWVYYFLDLDLPGDIVDPASNSTPLDMVWDCYSHQVHGSSDENVSSILYYACRDGFKSLSESVIEVVLLLHARTNIFHLASIEEQSLTVQRYIKNFLNTPKLRPFVKSDSNVRTGVFFYEKPDPSSPILSEVEWKTLSPEEQAEYKRINNNVEVLKATMESCNSKHGMLVLDEIDVMLGEAKRAAYRQSVNIPSPSFSRWGEERLPLTVLTSTRKTAFGLVQDEINEAHRTGLIIKHWNIMDVTRACPSKRHCPELPKVPIYYCDDTLTALSERDYQNLSTREQGKYEKTEGFSGCINNCKLFAPCKGRLATKQPGKSVVLKSITHVQNQFRKNSLEMAKAELLCLKPATTGLVYPRFDETKHVITPAQAYKLIVGEDPPEGKNFTKRNLIHFAKQRECPFAGGMDFGYSHLFAYVHGFKDLSTFFITQAVAAPELEPDQQIETMEQFKADNPAIYPDPENAQLIKVFKTNHFRMIKWKKIAGSVVGGISCVQMKLTPPLGAPPELYIVREVGEDPGIDLLVRHLREHHWKLDAANKPTDMISDDNKDLPDAFRYCIMNVFPYKGKTTIDKTESQLQGPPIDDTGVQYHVTTWMAQKIAELTGQDYNALPKKREVKIESLDGKRLVFDYYSESKQAEPENENKIGKAGGVFWDLG